MTEAGTKRAPQTRAAAKAGTPTEANIWTPRTVVIILAFLAVFWIALGVVIFSFAIAVGEVDPKLDMLIVSVDRLNARLSVGETLPGYVDDPENVVDDMTALRNMARVIHAERASKAKNMEMMRILRAGGPPPSPPQPPGSSNCLGLDMTRTGPVGMAIGEEAVLKRLADQVTDGEYQLLVERVEARLARGESQGKGEKTQEKKEL